MARVSSSSSARDRSLRVLLDESFSVLRQEVPEAHRRMCAELHGDAVAIRVDDESVVVTCDGAAMHTQDTGMTDGVSAEIRTSRKAILHVLNGHVTLTDAVLADAVGVRASLEALVRLNRGLALYVHGAVRAPSFPELLERFQRGPRSSKARGRARRL